MKRAARKRAEAVKAISARACRGMYRFDWQEEERYVVRCKADHQQAPKSRITGPFSE